MEIGLWVAHPATAGLAQQQVVDTSETLGADADDVSKSACSKHRSFLEVASRKRTGRINGTTGFAVKVKWQYP